MEYRFEKNSSRINFFIYVYIFETMESKPISFRIDRWKVIWIEKFAHSPVQFLQTAQEIDRLGHILYSFHRFDLKRFVPRLQTLIDLLQPEQTWKGMDEIYSGRFENSLCALGSAARHYALYYSRFPKIMRARLRITSAVIHWQTFCLACGPRPKCFAVIAPEPNL